MESEASNFVLCDELTLLDAEREWEEFDPLLYSEFDEYIGDAISQDIFPEILSEVENHYFYWSIEELMLIAVVQYRNYILNQCTIAEQAQYRTRVNRRLTLALCEEWAADSDQSDSPLSVSLLDGDSNSSVDIVYETEEENIEEEPLFPVGRT